MSFVYVRAITRQARKKYIF